MIKPQVKGTGVVVRKADKDAAAAQASLTDERPQDPPPRAEEETSERE
jgi:hypothetical protein